MPHADGVSQSIATLNGAIGGDTVVPGMSRVQVVSLLVGLAAATDGDALHAASLVVAFDEPGSIPPIVVNHIAAEAAAILHDAGVASLEFSTRTGDACSEDGEAFADVVVRIEHARIEARSGGSRHPVGSIQFLDGMPGRTITLSLSGAKYLLNQDPWVRTLLARVSPQVLDGWVGRMLGRALAHELVHYLLRSPRHSRTGLMRATHKVEDFIRPDRRAFRLTAADRQLLLASSAVDGPAGSTPERP